MNYEFKKLADVESLNEVPEVATVFAEVNGEVKRIPSSGLGGVVKTAIIKSSDYDDAIASMMSQSSGPVALDADAVEPSFTLSCLNMTFEEAYETMAAGEPLDAKAMVVYDGPAVISAQAVAFGGVAMTGSPLIGFMGEINGSTLTLFWTADGISTERPGGVS